MAANGNTLGPAPVAIVGMSCRLPGDVSSLDQFWTMLSRARSGWGEIPKDKFSSDAYRHPSPQKRGCFNQKGGYFLDRDVTLFDAPFFNITQSEAKAMDPQQRQLLECTYEALENAGAPKESIVGSKTGVFIGGSASDYRMGTLRDLESLPMFDATGNHQSVQSGRLSHYFDFRGPSFTVDTACSSGLHALHQAVQSIRLGESSQAVVAGCRLSTEPDDWVSMSMLGIFNEEGKTHTFDHRAKSGFARGEGAGCLIVKPLDKAIEDNDKIWSVIVNTGIGQDGKTVGLSTPSSEAQEALMREVYAKAHINPSDTGYFEAHGTGTKVGDPIEARAIYNVFGASRTKRQPLNVGSVKTNVGHLENVSGIISVIKASLMLDKGFIPPNLNFEKANPSIPLDQWNMKVPTTLKPWPQQKRFISINNFGFSGSNAHCVLERPPRKLCDLPLESRTVPPKLFVISANDEKAARKIASSLGVYMEQHPEAFQKRVMRDIAYTLGERRSHLSWRVALAASSCSDLIIGMNGPDMKPVRASSKVPEVAFVYTGQGAQWATMGRELLESHPVFADTMLAADLHLRSLGADFSLLKELAKEADESQVGKAHISQPACTAVQLALTELFRSFGIRPTAVTGHSSGEIAAAYAAGAITLESAMAAAYYRGQATLRMKEQYSDLRGSMLAVGAGPDEVRRVVKIHGLQGVTIACENSPASVTASGDEDMIDRLAEELEVKGVFNRKLRVEVAYHSAHMELVADDYHEAIRHIYPETKSSDVAFFSSLQGRRLSSMAELDSRYWVENLTRPVLFSSALKDLCTQKRPDLVVEIGPHSALEGPVKQILKAMGKGAQDVKYLPSLVRKQDATISALKVAGSLFTKGYPIDFTGVNLKSESIQKPFLISDFAPYPWAEHHYWAESRISRQHRFKKFLRHDLLGLLTDNCSDAEPVWRNVLTTDDVPWLKDHKMQSLTTFPLAGYLCMAVEAASQRATMRGVNYDRFRLREIHASRPLIMDDGADAEVMLSMRSQAEGTRSYSDEWDEFRILSWTSNRGWLEHCRGLVSVRKLETNTVNSSTRQASVARLRDAEESCTQSVDLATFYADLDSHGASYGPFFRFHNECGFRSSTNSSISDLIVPETATCMPANHEAPSILSTAFTDLFLQLTFAILGAGRGGMRSLYMPSAIKDLELGRTVPNTPGEKLRVVACGEVQPGPVDFSIEAWHAGENEPVVSMAGFRMTPIKDEGMEQPTPRSLCYKLGWETLDADKEINNGHANANGHANGNGINGHADSTNGNGTNGHSTNGHAINDTDSNGHATNGHATNGTADHSSIIIVTSRSTTDPLVQGVVETLALRTGQTPVVTTFENLQPSHNHVICLSELDEDLLSNMTAESFTKVQSLLTTSASVLWVTSGASQSVKTPLKALANGLFRTVRSETGRSVATIDLDPESTLSTFSHAELIGAAFSSILDAHPDGPHDYEFSEKDAKLVVPRVTESSEANQVVYRETESSAMYPQNFGQDNRRLKIAVGTTGALDSLYWQNEPEEPLADDEVEIKIAATGMNFKDVVIAMGQVASPYLGVECSGVISRTGAKVNALEVEDRVCAMTLGAYGTYTRCKATSATIVPRSMSLETAASIPVVFSTAYYGIIEVARLEPGERILIHAASGGVGQAAIQLAQMTGAEVFATVGSHDKKLLIMEKYKVPEDHIFYSRSTEFGPAIREATGGQGVDVVINSLAGDLLRETWDCVAHFGRFIEIGKRDITANTRLEMAKFAHNATFSSVDLTLLAEERPRIMARVLTAVMALLRDGKISPIAPVTVMSISEVETALRLLQGGKTSGKVVIAHRPDDQVKATHRANTSDSLHGDATYIIIGGTGGLGRSMARWMVQRGARHLVLLSRTGAISDELKSLIRDVQPIGAHIHVQACDVGDADSVNDLITQCKSSLPPIRGIIHAAMVLRDMLFEKMGFSDFTAVTRSKVSGAWNFHTALQSQPLDFFILLSSVAGVVGNRGQAAYAAANTFLDALAHHRVSLGLPATSLDLTAISDVGYLAENTARQGQVMQTLAGDTMREAEVLALLSSAITGDVGTQLITGLDFSGPSLPYYASDARFTPLLGTCTTPTATTQTLTISQRLTLAPDSAGCVSIVAGGLREKLCAILMLAPEDMDPASSVTAYGLDSLNAIELRNWIGKELGVHLQVLELLTSGTLEGLAGVVLRKTRLECCWTEEA